MSTLEDFKTNVKREYRLEGDDTNFNPLITKLMNDAFLAYARKNDHPDFLLIDEAILCTAATSEITLPDDFLRFASGFIRFKQDDNVQWDLYRQSNSMIGSRGWPVVFRRAGLSLYVRPFDRLIATNAILLDYYARPIVLIDGTDDAEDLPSLSLEDWVFYEVLAKLALYHDSNNYTKYKQEANIKFMESRAEVQ